MTAPRWATALLRRLAPPGRAEDVLGDLEEVHRRRRLRRGRVLAVLLTALESLDVAVALLRGRLHRRTAPAASAPAAVRRLGGGSGGLSWLDFKLGFRMLAKYPGLTVVGGAALAFAIAVGAGSFQFISDLVYPELPFDSGEQIVELRYWDAAASRPDHHVLPELVRRRKALQSIDDLGAYRTQEQNLRTDDGRAEPVVGAEISASAFRLAGVPPLVGRTLAEADEETAAPPVVLLGHRVWRDRFDGDPEVVGRTVGLGDERATVVGVMPPGFGFPIAHRLWTPLRPETLTEGAGRRPRVRFFGRLAPGATFDAAQAELSAFGKRTDDDVPDTHRHLRPQVLPYASTFFHTDQLTRLGLYSLNLLFSVLFLVLVSANVALLVFARSATREGEIVLRNALGASRGRIILQLFSEALVLAGVAAAVGIAGAELGLAWALGVFDTVQEGSLPFWFHHGLAPKTVAYVAGLAVLGAVVAGIAPALKVTGRDLQAQLQRISGRASGLQVGGLWTGVIVTQVAVTVLFVPVVILVGRDTAEIRRSELGFPAHEVLAVRLDWDPAASATADSRRPYRELARRLEEEPGVTGVGLADRLPGGYHPLGWIEVEGEVERPPSALGHRTQSASIDPGFFDALDVPILAGRAFHSGDLDAEQGVVIVNEAFVQAILGGRNPIGRRLRYRNSERPHRLGAGDPPPEPWLEIVGVVRQLTMTLDPDLRHGAGLYHPLAPDDDRPLWLMAHVGREPESLAPRLRALATAVDPALRLVDLRTADEAAWALLLSYDSWFRVIVAAAFLGLLLANAGIYSVMALTVSRRTREIGLRVALGADRRRIVAAVFTRALRQVGLGVVAGTGLFFSLAVLTSETGIRISATDIGILLAYMASMMGVCLLACLVPVCRALRVEPSEALRADG